MKRKWPTLKELRAKARADKCCQKNALIKKTKLSTYHTEQILECFAADLTIREAHEYLKRGRRKGFSDITIRRHYKVFRELFILGALRYPALFGGAGSLLWLGPPLDFFFNIHVREVNKHSRFKHAEDRNTQIFERLLRAYVYQQLPFDVAAALKNVATQFWLDYYGRTDVSATHPMNAILASEATQIRCIWRIYDTEYAPLPKLRWFNCLTELGGTIVPVNEWFWTLFLFRDEVKRNEIRWSFRTIHRDLRWCLRHSLLNFPNRKANPYTKEQSPSIERQVAIRRLLLEKSHENQRAYNRNQAGASRRNRRMTDPRFPQYLFRDLNVDPSVSSSDVLPHLLARNI